MELWQKSQVHSLSLSGSNYQNNRNLRNCNQPESATSSANQKYEGIAHNICPILLSAIYFIIKMNSALHAMLAFFEFLPPSLFTSQFNPFYPIKPGGGIFPSCKARICLEISEKYNMFNLQCEIYTFTIKRIVLFASIPRDLRVAGQITVSHQEFQGSYIMISSYPSTLLEEFHRSLSAMERALVFNLRAMCRS